MGPTPDIRTIVWERGEVRIIDQTRLPIRLCYRHISRYGELVEAIQKLQIRGAPAIGIAAAFGLVLGLRASRASDADALRRDFDRIAGDFLQTRPTAVNLSAAIRRLEAVLVRNMDKQTDELRALLEEEAMHIYEEDTVVCRAIGHNGASLLRDGWTVITYCNAGALATAGYGTALGCVYAAMEEGKRLHLFVCETRPVLQGARLTAWELQRAGVDVTLICDNMAAWMMKTQQIDCALVGADRIAANGDVANKIGTYSLAIAAREHDLPFYVAAPLSTFDLTMKNGEAIPVEQRDEIEVTHCLGHRIAAPGVKVNNPAFDVTPARLVTSIICEKGIASSPYEKSLAVLAG